MHPIIIQNRWYNKVYSCVLFFERDYSAKIIITNLMKLHHSQHDRTFQASYRNL